MLEIKHATTRVVLLRLDGDTWEGRNLASAALDGANLANLRLNHSVLRQARLRRADLTGAELSNTCLDGANLERARLAKSDLTSATLLGAVLVGADLQRSILRYASLVGATCEGANLAGADMSMCDARANFRQANLAGCDLRGANLAGANLQQADLTGADLTGANLSGAVMVGAKTQGAKLPPPGERTAPPPPGLTGDAAPGTRPAPTRSHAPRPTSSRSKPETEWITRSGPDFDSIPVTCPECGFSTRVATAHTDGTYRCRACQCLFKLDQSTAKSKSAKKTKKAPVLPWEPKKAPSKLLNRLAQVAVTLVALGILAAAGYGVFMVVRSHNGAESISDRALLVAEAYVDKNEDRLTALGPANSASLMTEWLRRRPARWDSLIATGKPKLFVVKTDQGSSNALVAVRVTFAGPESAGSNPEIVNLNLSWKLTENSGWQFDPPATLKTAPPQY